MNGKAQGLLWATLALAASCSGQITSATSAMPTESSSAAGDSPSATDNVPTASVPVIELASPAQLGKTLTLAPWHVDVGAGADFSVYVNAQKYGLALEQITSNAQRAVIVFHGADRNPLADTSDMVSALTSSAQDPNVATTLVIGVYYMAQISSWPASTRPKQPVSWADDGYMQGDNADGAGPSSFAVVDSILTRLAQPNAFPKLKAVTLAGHSAGGQTAQLYTAAMGEKSRLGTMSYPFNLVTLVANPSSYPYPNDQRPSNNGFAVADASKCSNVNQWKYGLASIPSTVANGTPQQLAAALAHRPVFHALGDLDNNPNDSTMDQSCAAEAQGATRLVRGQQYFAHQKALFADSTHSLCVVPGVAHDVAAMFKSSCTTDVLFRAVP